MTMQMDAEFKKEQSGTLFCLVGALQGGFWGWVVPQGCPPQKVYVPSRKFKYPPESGQIFRILDRVEQTYFYKSGQISSNLDRVEQTLRSCIRFFEGYSFPLGIKTTGKQHTKICWRHSKRVRS